MTTLHRQLTGEQVHAVHFKEYADAAAREADITLDDTHEGKLALQLSDRTLWQLVSGGSAPVWSWMGGGTVTPPAATQEEMEAGVEDELRLMSPVLVAQAIAAMVSGGRVAEGAFTIAAVGPQQITGVGFSPKCVLLVASFDQSYAVDGASVGFAVQGGASGCLAFRYGGTAGRTGLEAYATSLYLSASESEKATVQSFDADGFTLAITRVGQKYTTHARYLAFE